ncbi:MAG: putative transcriptional regulatory protein pdtaR [Anaerolineae bacterium]|nr:putative transcriptional regulatory protein pdtaR [Anaerolineae bacterium]MDL1895368.1 response regulator [Anaerolineae bacterium CFX7]RIK34450.1 MAG: response regulator [Chloroflexota bacterium]
MKTLRIVIADDESLHLLSLREQLESMGHRVVGEADDGHGALQLLRDVHPDLAILDIKMPEPDGIQVAETIMQAQPLPIILLSAYSEGSLAERAAHAHVAAYLMKPVLPQDLMPAIALAISRFEEFQTLNRQVRDLHDALETRKVVERAKGILMRRLNLTEEEAFRRMQRRSQNENKKMSEIADAIITADGML